MIKVFINDGDDKHDPEARTTIILDEDGRRALIQALSSLKTAGAQVGGVARRIEIVTVGGVSLYLDMMVKEDKHEPA